MEIDNGFADMLEGRDIAFIVGSPRSGTTILGEILHGHDQICQWYEPYFVWDHHFRNAADDERSAKDCSPTILKQIKKDFERYLRRMGKRMVIDKSPRNSLKIPFILEIFPRAKFIHILRDGRDVTLSIHKEWKRRENMVRGAGHSYRFNYGKAAKVIKMWLARQRFLKDKMRALWFETHGHFLDRSSHLNRLRWDGMVGWGPRFRGWREVLQKATILQFNAYQWLECVEIIGKHWSQIPEENRLMLRYESLITEPVQILASVLKFLNKETYKEFFLSLPKMKKNNSQKWKQEFTSNQLYEIQPILTPKLLELGYEKRADWHLATDPLSP